jgi:hypothetical protein
MSQEHADAAKKQEEELDAELSPADKAKKVEWQKKVENIKKKCAFLLNPPKAKGVHTRLIDLFHRFDVDKNGGLDRSELRTCFQVLGVPLTSTEFDLLADEFDKTGDNFIDYREFVDQMHATSEAGEQNSLEVEALYKLAGAELRPAAAGKPAVARLGFERGEKVLLKQQVNENWWWGQAKSGGPEGYIVARYVGARNERMHQVYEAMPDFIETSIIDQLDPAPHVLMSQKYLEELLTELRLEAYIGTGNGQLPLPDTCRRSGKSMLESDSEKYFEYIQQLCAVLDQDRMLSGDDGYNIEQRLHGYCDDVRKYIGDMLEARDKKSAAPLTKVGY